MARAVYGIRQSVVEVTDCTLAWYLSNRYTQDMSDTRAHAAVWQAIRAGKLPHPTTLRCVDCGAIATAYDHHRGYARKHWLDVEPICDSCNASRAYAARREDAPESAEISAVLLRLPTWLLPELDRESRDAGRSRNSQLIWILKERYPEVASQHTDLGFRTRGSRLREEWSPYKWSAA